MCQNGLMITLNTILPEELHNLRLDQALAKVFPQYSRARLQSWIKNQQVLVDGKVLRPKDKIQAGQTINISAHIEAETSWEAQPIDLTIVYEDEAILIINKPAGLVVHPAVGNRDQTLVNALLHYAPELANIPRCGVVHRLDKDTSGLMVVARSLEAHTFLVKEIQEHKVTREYAAIVNGVLTCGGMVDANIARHPRLRTHMAVVEHGKSAITHYRVTKRFRNHSLLKVVLETGRTHQIRVHMAHLGYPLIGDPRYGGRLKIPSGCTEQLRKVLTSFKRQALHAEKLGLIHPVTRQPMVWEAALPADMVELLQALKEDSSNS